MLACPWGTQGTATIPCLLREFPCQDTAPLPGHCSLARQALTGFLVLVPQAKGQWDVPEYHCSTVLAHSSSMGCQEPLCW